MRFGASLFLRRIRNCRLLHEGSKCTLAHTAATPPCSRGRFLSAGFRLTFIHVATTIT